MTDKRLLTPEEKSRAMREAIDKDITLTYPTRKERETVLLQAQLAKSRPVCPECDYERGDDGCMQIICPHHIGKGIDPELREEIETILQKDMTVRVVDTIHGKEKEYFFPRGVAKIITLFNEKKIRKQERERIIGWLYDHSLQITRGQCWTHGEGRFIPENNMQALGEE